MAAHRTRLHGGLESTAEIRGFIEKALETAPFPEERLFDMKVAVSEATANAIEHAGDESTAPPVEVALYELADRVVVTIEDQGVFFPSQRSGHDHFHRGMGLPLMVSLSDEVFIRSTMGGGTSVSLTFLRPGVPPADAVKLIPQDAVVHASELTAHATIRQELDEQLERTGLLHELALTVTAPMESVEQLASRVTGVLTRRFPELFRVIILHTAGDPGELHVVTDCEVAETKERSRFPKVPNMSDERCVTIPLTYRNSAVGAVQLFFLGSRHFTEQELSLYRSIGHIVGQSIASAALAESQARSHSLSQALNEINDLMNSIRNTEEMLRRVVESACEAMEAESCGLALRTQSGWAPRFVHNMPEELTRQTYADDELPMAAEAARRRDVVCDREPRSVPRVAATAGRASIRASLTVPLILRDEVTAVLWFHQRAAPRHYFREEIDFSRRLADSLSLALENARLFETERQIAEILQASHVPLPEEMTGIRVEHLYRSATEAARVGGDFYDVFPLPGDCVGLLIGDIAGHGIGAAKAASLVRNTVRAYVHLVGAPSRTMDLVNSMLLRAPNTDFVTAFFGVLDTGSGRLAYASAGHPPALRLSGGSTRSLDVFSTPLGVLEGATYEERAVMLDPGDVLLFYTDGLIEPRRHGEIFGERRLMKAFERLTEEGVGEVPQRLLAEVEEWAFGRLPDDVAVLLLSWTGHGGD